MCIRDSGKPGVSVVKPSYGFPGASIVFEGQEFVSSKTLYTLTFGTSTDKAEIVGTPTDTEFTAKMPETAVSGVITLIMAEQTIDLSSYPFTVLKHATLDTPKEDEPVLSGFAGSKFMPPIQAVFFRISFLCPPCYSESFVTQTFADDILSAFVTASSTLC